MAAGDGPFALDRPAPPPPLPSRRQVMAGRIKLGLLFAGCFLASTLALGIAARIALPPAEIVELTGKFHPLVRQDDGVDTIVIGSSRVLRDFMPSAFDAGAAAAGCPLHSYNLGVADMNVIEMRYLLRRVAAARLPHLKRILFDPPNDIHVSFANLHSERMWVTTDPRDALRALGDIWSHPDPRKFSATARYTAAFVYRNSALGLLGRILHPGPVPDPPWPDSIDATGFQAQDPAAATTDPSRALMLQTFDQFKAQLAQLERQDAGDLPPAPIAAGQERRRIAGILEVAALIRGMGYQPAVLHLPDTYGEAITDAKDIERALSEQQPPIPDIDLMGSEWAPRIYKPDAWYDRTHLNRTAAGEASADAGASLCRQLGGG
jgi:hypothetical protein